MAEQTQAQKDAAAQAKAAAENQKRMAEQQGAAQTGANKLIDHLAATGTGRDKVAVAREALVDLEGADSEEAGAKAVLTHLRRRGVTSEGTIAKAERFIAAGLQNPEPVHGVFVPGITAPGVVPATMSPTGQVQTPAVKK